MAQLPTFVFSPNTLLSAIGLMRGPDTTRPQPADDWRDATVDVIIPAHNEQENIVRCLQSVLRQTLRPRHIVLVDDGSSDATAARAQAFCDFHGAEIVIVRRATSIGKTPAIKQQARALDSDVLFVLDADTVLESDNYLERTVEDLYQAVGIASACGTVLPLRIRDRRAADESFAVHEFVEAFPSHRAAASKSWLRTVASGITNLYREVLYLFLQRFVYPGQMAAFGTLCNPVGCAVAYRRTYLEALFDAVEPRFGDDLTNSEDIFIGMAMLNEGYRNVQVRDVSCRTVEPEVQRLPRQLYFWSSAFLQSAFYFDALLKSPFKALKRRARRPPASGGSDGTRERAVVPMRSVAFAGMGGTPPPDAMLSVITNIGDTMPWGAGGAGPAAAPLSPGERRRIREPYRQAFGHQHTERYGRPIGWSVMAAAIEKIGFPTVLLAMVFFRNWEGLLVSVAAETLITVVVLAVVMKRQRLEYVVKGIAVTPIRYALLAWELVTITRFASDMWLTRNRRWRK